MTNNILANSIATPATPMKPKNPAISAIIKKTIAQYSIFRSPLLTNLSRLSFYSLQKVNYDEDLVKV